MFKYDCPLQIFCSKCMPTYICLLNVKLHLVHEHCVGSGSYLDGVAQFNVLHTSLWEGYVPLKSKRIWYVLLGNSLWYVLFNNTIYKMGGNVKTKLLCLWTDSVGWFFKLTTVILNYTLVSKNSTGIVHPLWPIFYQTCISILFS